MVFLGDGAVEEDDEDEEDDEEEDDELAEVEEEVDEEEDVRFRLGDFSSVAMGDKDGCSRGGSDSL